MATELGIVIRDLQPVSPLQRSGDQLELTTVGLDIGGTGGNLSAIPDGTIFKKVGSAFVAAVAGTDYLVTDVPLGKGGTGANLSLLDDGVLVKKVGTALVAAVAGTDYLVSVPDTSYPTIGFFAGSTFTDSEIVGGFVFPRGVDLLADLPNCVAKLGVAPTSGAVFSLNKNGVGVGTITFSGVSTTGVFSFASTVNFAAGDVLTIVAPATADATAADLTVTLVGQYHELVVAG